MAEGRTVLWAQNPARGGLWWPALSSGNEDPQATHSKGSAVRFFGPPATASPCGVFPHFRTISILALFLQAGSQDYVIGSVEIIPWGRTGAEQAAVSCVHAGKFSSAIVCMACSALETGNELSLG